MADKKDDDDNPFSFKTFVSKERKTPTSGLTNTSAVNVDDIFDLNLGDSKLSGVAYSKIPKDGSPAGSGKSTGSKKSKSKENPFSFKKFLSGSASSSNSNDATPSSGPTPPIYSSSSAGARGYSALGTNLPDVDKNLSGKLSGGTDVPNFDLIGEQLQRNGFSLTTGSSHSSQGDGLFIDSKEEGAAGTSNDDMLPIPSLRGDASGLSGAGIAGISSALPDFLSDGAALTANSSGMLSSLSSSTHDDLLAQIHKLQEENTRLRKDLATERQRCSDKNQRLSQLQIDMERQKKKEAEETKVMERAVLQVEENLATTTQRAVQAEALAVKLKQELKAAQNQVKLLSAENHMLQSGDAGLSDIRERTKYTAGQLLSASAIAEKNIKELSSGVEQLKLLSQVLSSLEKVSEVKPDSPTDKADAKVS